MNTPSLISRLSHDGKRNIIFPQYNRLLVHLNVCVTLHLMIGMNKLFLIWIEYHSAREVGKNLFIEHEKYNAEVNFVDSDIGLNGIMISNKI